MAYDVMLLVAAADAGSDERLERAQAVIADPGAPRRALASEHAEIPSERLDTMRDPDEFDERDLNEIIESMEHWDRLFAAATPGVAANTPVAELTPQQRQAGYDALDDDQRAGWDATWRAAATEWLDIIGEWGSPTFGNGRFSRHVDIFPTTDGGQLLVCATHESEFDGVPAWFEAVQFSLGEVAEAAGYRQPTTFNVT